MYRSFWNPEHLCGSSDSRFVFNDIFAEFNRTNSRCIIQKKNLPDLHISNWYVREVENIQIFQQIKTWKILSNLFFFRRILCRCPFHHWILIKSNQSAATEVKADASEKQRKKINRQLINCRLCINQRDYKITKSDIVEENRKIKEINRLARC